MPMSLRRRWLLCRLSLQLMLWGWVMVWSTWSGRLDLLLRAVYHPVVGVGGALLMALGVLQFRLAWRQRASDSERGETHRRYICVLWCRRVILWIAARKDYNPRGAGRCRSDFG